LMNVVWVRFAKEADICESLHDHADELYRSCLTRFGDDGENL
ncbi:Rop family plasmid primer RNA-binding protein, partial [Escherichia coli]|nr:Rop family plasmid primer RNA-binding protein [Escherichia coli]